MKPIKKAVLDALFPIFCFSCQEEGSWLCETCLGKTKILDFQVCPDCEKIITEKGFLCPLCRDSHGYRLDGLIAAVPYQEPSVKKLVHSFKYRFIPHIAEPLSKLIIRALIRNDLPLPDFIVPIPLHPKRLRWRGFNQSFLLSENISQSLAPPLKIEVFDLLERKRYNRPQMEIKNYQERRRNVQNIFGIKNEIDTSTIKKKSFLLIDDISTSGATLQECAKILKSAGAKKVFGAVVARQNVGNN